jgi:hypothetical protein
MREVCDVLGVRTLRRWLLHRSQYEQSLGCTPYRMVQTWVYATTVTFSGFDSELLGQLDKSAASPIQSYFLQHIIRSIDPDTLLSQHAAALAGMASELPRAQSALLGYGERSQPRPSLLATLCQNALATVIRATSFRQNEPLLNDLIAELAAVPTSVIQCQDINQRKAAATQSAARLDTFIQGLPSLLASMFSEVWSLSGSKSDDWAHANYVGNEVACLVATSDRDSTTLQWQLTYALRRNGLDPVQILDTLLPTPVRHHVACLVKGAGKFSMLTILEPSAQQATSKQEDAIRWGPATNRLRSFLAKTPISSDDCIVSIDVDAVDKASAARLGRRRITELLDQYIAGNRLVQISLARNTLVTRAGALDTEEWQPRHRSVRKAYPLVYRWPVGLRETLRMAHLAQVTDSPLAAAALSWVALEACGVEYQRHRQLARALSLQALRQQTVESHQLIMQSVTASTRYANTQLLNASALRRKYDKALDRCPSDHSAYKKIKQLRDTAEANRVRTEAHTKSLNAKFGSFRAALEPYVVVNGSGHLVDLNNWVDILLPPRPSDTPQMTTARSALTAFLPDLSPLALQQTIDWQQLFNSCAECAGWLSVTQERIENLLDALYGARNLTLHSGIFAATGDAVLGIGSVMLVDFTLEFLGNWYRNVPETDPHASPVEVIEELADRQVNIVRRLKATAGAAYPLNVARLTSPSSTGWDRS